MKISRRAFLNYSTLAAGASLFPMSALAQTPSVALGNKTLMVVFLRGAADGLQLVSPTGPYVPQTQIDAYKALRPARVEKPQGAANLPEYNYIGYVPAVDRGSPPAGVTYPPQPETLDGFFELHPKLQTFKNHYDSANMAVIHAVGQAGSRSHFDAQDAVEYGNPITSNGQTATTGWMHDSINTIFNGATWDTTDRAQKVAAGLGLGEAMPVCFAGNAQSDKTVSFLSMDGFGFSGSMPIQKRAAIESLFASKGTFSSLRDSALVAMEVEQKVNAVTRGTNGRIFAAANNSNGSSIGSRYAGYAGQLEDVADMVKDGSAPAFINIDLASWDSHDNQYNHVNSVAAALNAVGCFYDDLGSDASKICTLVMTEFGRTLNVNEDYGTDHGHGGVMFVFGGGVNGGQVYGQWPGLPTSDGMGGWLANDPAYPTASDPVGDRAMLRATTSFQQVYYDLLTEFMMLSPTLVAQDVLKGYTPGTSLGLFTSGA